MTRQYLEDTENAAKNMAEKSQQQRNISLSVLTDSIWDENKVLEFKEKPQTSEGWINGGFFIFEKKIFDYLHGDDTILESDALENLAKAGELMAYKHYGFWQCMDTLRDKIYLNKIWDDGNAPWKKWD